ncbi:MAG: hypothetical protein ACXABY_09865 [Candidatus Thorarchaeota archaeon]
MNTDNSIVLWRSRNGTKPAEFMDFMTSTYEKNLHHFKDGIFVESMEVHNGHKVLGSKIKRDYILLLVLEKKAYVGLTMLNMESSLREIEKIMETPDSEFSQIQSQILKTGKLPKGEEEDEP